MRCGMEALKNIENAMQQKRADAEKKEAAKESDMKSKAFQKKGSQAQEEPSEARRKISKEQDAQWCTKVDIKPRGTQKRKVDIHQNG